MKALRLALTLILIVALALPLTAAAEEARPVTAVESPVFLNGEEEYTTTADTGFTNILTTAMKQATGAHISILAAGQVKDSLQSGRLTVSGVSSVLEDDSLVVVTMNQRELKSLLNRVLEYESKGFPHFAGMTLRAEKYLNDEGAYAAEVSSIIIDGAEPNDEELVNVAVSSGLYAGEYGYTFVGSAFSADITLVEAFMQYMAAADVEVIADVANEMRSLIVGDTIDTEGVITKLELDVPTPVHICLSVPAIVPDTVFYALKNQNRNLVCTVMEQIPYSITFNGINIATPAGADLAADITQELPAGRRAASSADSNAVFVDLRENHTLPHGSVLTVDIGEIYPPETLLYLYYYDAIEDIVPAAEDDSALIVDDNGKVSFQAAAGTTYLLNSRPLNEAVLFENPTPENPFVPGIIVIVALYTLWCVLFFVLKKRKNAKSKG